MDLDLLGRQLVRALRGSRSQTALSRRMGYRTNVFYLWESGRSAPTAGRFFRLASVVGVDLRRSIARFFRSEPSWLAERDIGDGAALVAPLLAHLRGKASVVELSREIGCNRFALSRWLKGKVDPALSDFMRYVEASSGRLLDFLAGLVPLDRVPVAKARWQALLAARTTAYDLPWSHAVLRAMELDSYARLERHEPGWFCRQLGITRAMEAECLELLARTGQIHSVDGKWQLANVLAVDTRENPKAARRLKSFWLGVAEERLGAGVDGVFSYNLFGVSRKDLERLKELQRAYFRELRRIVAESQPVETVAIVNTQLLSLLETPPEAPAGETSNP